MNQYTIYCTKEQTRKALELGAPIERITCYVKGYCPQRTIKIEDADKPYYCYFPTAEQIIGWLEEQGITIDFEICIDCHCSIYDHNRFEFVDIIIKNTRKEATLVAIDATLDYLMNNKKRL